MEVKIDPKKKYLPRINYLDGFRGIAAIVVYLHHVAGAFYPAIIFGSAIISSTKYEFYIYGTPLNLLFNGNFGVCIFFTLSGYILSSKLFIKHNQPKLLNLIIQRYLRLEIPLAISLVISYFVLKHGLFLNNIVGKLSGSEFWFSQFWNFKPSLIGLFQQIVLNPLLYLPNSYNPVIWMIPYQFLGSIFIYLFFFMFGRGKKRSVIYIILFIVLFKTYFLGFLLGLIRGDMFVNYDHHKVSSFLNKYKLKKILSIIALFFGLILGSFPIASLENTVYQYIRLPLFSISASMVFYHSIGSFLVLESIFHLDFLQSFLSRKIFVFFGKISYSLYLLQFIIIGSIFSLLFVALYTYLPYNLSFMIAFIISSLVTVLFSTLYYKQIEGVGINLSKRFLDKHRLFGYKV